MATLSFSFLLGPRWGQFAIVKCTLLMASFLFPNHSILLTILWGILGWKAKSWHIGQGLFQDFVREREFLRSYIRRAKVYIIGEEGANVIRSYMNMVYRGGWQTMAEGRNGVGGLLFFGLPYYHK